MVIFQAGLTACRQGGRLGPDRAILNQTTIVFVRI